jgi:predicted AAA+ superfamily ATPase
MVNRELFKKAAVLLKKFPMIAITGPRQSGKTTFAKMLHPEYQYVNLEQLDERQFAREESG